MEAKQQQARSQGVKRRTPSPCQTQISSFSPQMKTCLSWCYALNCRPDELISSSYFYVKNWYHTTTSDFIRWHSWNSHSRFSTQPFSIFPVTFSSMFPRRIQVHSLLHSQCSLQSQTCNRLVYHQETSKFT